MRCVAGPVRGGADLIIRAAGFCYRVQVMGGVSADILTLERLYTVTTATKLSSTSVLFETSMPNQAARPVATVAVPERGAAARAMQT